MEKKQENLLRTFVRNAPMINGFSYPFLYLLVNKAVELHEAGHLLAKNAFNQHVLITPLAAALLSGITKQLDAGWDFKNWGVGENADTKAVNDLLMSAHDFLDVFEEKPS